MATLKKIKNQISAIQKTRQITNAMYQIAVSKIKKSDLSHQFFLNFDQEFLRVFSLIASKKSDIFNTNFDQKGSLLYIVISQDRGLCGAYHNRLFKYFDDLLISKDLPVFVLPIGRKAFTYYTKKNLNIISEKPILNKDDITLFNLEQTSKNINQLFAKGFISGVYIVYNRVLGQADFTPVTEQIYPVVVPNLGSTTDVDHFEIDQRLETITSQLLTTYLESRIYKALINAKKTEHTARMMAMKNASDNSLKITDKLKLKYHRMRQQTITNELIDIVAGGKEEEDGR